MQDCPNGFDTPMLGLAGTDWLARLEEIAEEHGHFQPLGGDHWASFVEDKPILLVTFETIAGIAERGDTGQPLGFELVRELGWSHLCLLSQGDSWFRDPAVYGYFDRLGDDGFFDDFETVIFYGAGPCGYAAAAFSVAAPGARVVALNPQATLDPRLTGWDRRYPGARRLDFNDRYGFAPDMIEAACQAFVIHTRDAPLDAMHAALFRRANVQLLPVPDFGRPLEAALLEMQLLFRILAQASVGRLTVQSFARLIRTRRDFLPYLRHLRSHLLESDRVWLTALLCA
ncbi:phosphoadenosine phosphosulfate reductase, partial [Shimia sp.]|uniref:phosphoadenosine phosphosulfate reductase n=1 Tax=Shimia sp. TaxID=1954381 RepID=UPI0035647C6E